MRASGFGLRARRLPGRGRRFLRRHRRGVAGGLDRALGDGEAEGGAVARLRLDPDPAAVALDDLAAERQADAGAGVLVAGVQALEHAEDALVVLGRDADAVVGDADLPA